MPISSTFLGDFVMHNSQQLLDPSHYRRIVGSLQHLTITRPDLSYIVNLSGQYMSSPNVAPKSRSQNVCMREHKTNVKCGVWGSQPLNVIGYDRFNSNKTKKYIMKENIYTCTPRYVQDPYT